MAQKIRWGVIGAGGIADRRTIPGMMLCDNAELVAVMEINMELAEKCRANSVQVIGSKFAQIHHHLIGGSSVEGVPLGAAGGGGVDAVGELCGILVAVIARMLVRINNVRCGGRIGATLGNVTQALLCHNYKAGDKPGHENCQKKEQTKESFFHIEPPLVFCTSYYTLSAPKGQ